MLQHRLAHEPRRPWKRYLHIVPLFFVFALAQIIVHRVGRHGQVEVKEINSVDNVKVSGGLITG